jgi:pimeloyl-ACP methyl ester carboxylesterase
VGEFVFDGYPPLSDRPVRVFYIAPADPASAEILVVMHGLGRDGQEYRSDWENLVKDRNVLVLVPEFSEDHYPGPESYNLGNVVDSDYEPVRRERWSFNLIEALFDFVRRDIGNSSHGYMMFGHSAGAQFVHRFVMFMPENRVRVAVAANAGWYTMPDSSEPFPYGLNGSPITTGGLGPAFETDLIILLGADDIDPADDSLRRDERSDEQGRHRLERGITFYRTAREMADEKGLQFRWRLQMVPGLAHEHRQAAAAAAPLLLGEA